MQAPYARASLIPYLTGLCREEVRQRLVAGQFGPRYQCLGRQRQTLVRLDKVMAVLALDDAALAAGIGCYRQDRRTNRPPILSLDPTILREIAP